MIRANTRGDGRIQAAAGPLAMEEAQAGPLVVVLDLAADPAGRLEAVAQVAAAQAGRLEVAEQEALAGLQEAVVDLVGHLEEVLPVLLVLPVLPVLPEQQEQVEYLEEESTVV